MALLARGDDFGNYCLLKITRYLEQGGALHQASRAVRMAALRHRVHANIAGTMFRVVLENVNLYTNTRAFSARTMGGLVPLGTPRPALDTRWIKTLTIHRREQRWFFSKQMMATAAQALLLRSAYLRLNAIFIADSLMTRLPLPARVLVQWFTRLNARRRGGVKTLFVRRIKGPLTWLPAAASPKLTNLTVAQCRRIPHVVLAKTIRRCPNLKTLRLNFTGVSAEVLQAVSACAKLTTFTSGPFLQYMQTCLHSTAGQDPSGLTVHYERAADAVMPVITQCTRLITLCLKRQVLTPRFFSAVATHLPQLEHLELTHCWGQYSAHAGDPADAFEVMCQSLSRLSMLVVIETPSLRQRFAPILARGMLTHVPKLTQLTYLKIDQTTNCTIRAAEYTKHCRKSSSARFGDPAQLHGHDAAVRGAGAARRTTPSAGTYRLRLRVPRAARRVAGGYARHHARRTALRLHGVRGPFLQPLARVSGAAAPARVSDDRVKINTRLHIILCFHRFRVQYKRYCGRVPRTPNMAPTSCRCCGTRQDAGRATLGVITLLLSVAALVYLTIEFAGRTVLDGAPNDADALLWSDLASAALALLAGMLLLSPDCCCSVGRHLHLLGGRGRRRSGCCSCPCFWPESCPPASATTT